MRLELSNFIEQRKEITATFVKYGLKRNSDVITVLVRDVYIEDIFVTDHAWLFKGKQFNELPNIKEGDKISFNATIKLYEKGKNKDKLDFRFSHVTKVKKI